MSALISPQGLQVDEEPSSIATNTLDRTRIANAEAEHVNLFWTPEIKVNVFSAPSLR